MLLTATPAFTSPEDIANRALDHIGADNSIVSLLTDVSKNQRVIKGVYTKLRQAELRRNDWKFAIRKSILRPVALTSMLWSAPAWSNATTYRVGQVVSYDDGYGARLWQNVLPSNVNNAPGGAANAWDNYFGALVASLYVAGTSYYPGDLVYKTDGAGAFTLYSSLTSGNTEDPATTDAFDATVTYRKDDIVSSAAQNYISLIDGNLAHTPASSPTEWATTALTGSLKWVTQAGTIKQLNILYPIEAGPVSETDTANVFPLPYGFLRKATRQDPKAGLISVLGVPGYALPTDYILSGPYLLSRAVTAIMFRFIGDVSVVPSFDPMFCEGFAGRIAVEACKSITGSTDELRAISALYVGAIREARLVNAIENDAVEEDLDDWIACRA